ncbi:MAG: hypothetical protein JNK64_25220 [Myxococcales bacterium]|nr:hypothetical protein [Myxococcales bacterium]
MTVLAMGALAATGCGKVPGVGGKSKVDPNSCGNYAVSDVGRKLHGFLEATAALDVEATRVESVVKESCVIMGHELKMPESDLSGSTDAVCNKVIEYLKGSLSANFKADAKLDIQYKPAVCTVNADVAASAAAQCEAKAEADIGVTCNGTCNGTCDGQCSGSGTAGTGGSSGSGNCNGQCSGTCHGGCDGTADVNASAQCKAEAEVKASVDVQCTEPELTVNADASVMVDTTKAEATLAAIRNGMPKMLSIQARIRPLQAAFVGWAKSARELGASAGDVAGSFKDQALCISGQISAAVAAVAHVEASINVSVSVSASASGAVGTN